MQNNKRFAKIHRARSIVMRRIVLAQEACLAIVALIALTTLCAWIIPALGQTVLHNWTQIKVNAALAALASAASLAFSLPRRSSKKLILSGCCAILVAILAFPDLIAHFLHVSLRFDTLIAADPLSHHPGQMSVQGAAAFAILSLLLLVIRANRGVARIAADCLVFALGLLVLIMVARYLFGAPRGFLGAPPNWVSAQALWALCLLTVVAGIQRSEFGALKILFTTGVAGGIARRLTPIVLLLPFLREAGRPQLIRLHLFPEQYAAPTLASIAAVLSLAMVLSIGWRIHRMEEEIHDLTLRDELTGLYNLRGFRLLADQALRLAQRSRMPFSVLFVDLDNLKQINDGLGHALGSEFLVQTAELLRSSFRQTDVIGRVGGDEFAVAGQFSQTAISFVARRLEEQSSRGGAIEGPGLPLSLSIGFDTTDAGNDKETLQDLLDKADAAMYEHKRNKKLQVC